MKPGEHDNDAEKDMGDVPGAWLAKWSEELRGDREVKLWAEQVRLDYTAKEEG